METGLIAIEIAARIHSVPMDVQSVRKKYFVERELSPEEMIRILRDHGFKANHRRLSSLEELKGYPLPQIILTPERDLPRPDRDEGRQVPDLRHRGKGDPRD